MTPMERVYASKYKVSYCTVTLKLHQFCKSNQFELLGNTQKSYCSGTPWTEIG